MKVILAALFLMIFAQDIYGGLGNIASEHGLNPDSVASSNSAALFMVEPAAAYYNPAGLSTGKATGFSPGIMTVVPSFKTKGEGGVPKLPVRQAYSTLGIKLNIGSGFGFTRRLNLGLNLAAADLGRKIFNFEDAVQSRGQELRYGKKPMFLNVGMGLAVTEHLNLGVGALLTVDGRANASMHVETDGETSEEVLGITGKTRAFLIFGLLYNTPTWSVALSIRDQSFYHIKIDSKNHLRAVAEGPIPLNFKALDTYTPRTYSIGFKGRAKKYVGYLTLDWLQYSLYQKTANRLSTIQQTAGLEFVDVLVPRLGGRYIFDSHIEFLAGISYEQSPHKRDVTLGTNYMDHDKYSVSLGMSYLLMIDDTHPVKLSFGSQFHKLLKRQIALNSPTFVNQNPENSGSLTSEGQAVVMSFSLTSNL